MKDVTSITLLYLFKLVFITYYITHTNNIGLKLHQLPNES